MFADGRSQELNGGLGITNARIMPTTGTCTALPRGNNRQNLTLSPETIHSAIQQLRQANGHGDHLGRALPVTIRIFSGAARFSPVSGRGTRPGRPPSSGTSSGPSRSRPDALGFVELRRSVSRP
ncbi:hypothetical protein ACWD4P_35610 [Kitasatospora sp. NPDC002543]